MVQVIHELVEQALEEGDGGEQEQQNSKHMYNQEANNEEEDEEEVSQEDERNHEHNVRNVAPMVTKADSEPDRERGMQNAFGQEHQF